MRKLRLLLVLLTSVALAGCEDLPPDPPTHVRTLGRRGLFGELSPDNRLLDPLLSFTGSGVYASAANDFLALATLHRRIDLGAPTRMPYLHVAANPGAGSIVLFIARSSPTPQRVELWLGRDGERAAFDATSVSFDGVFRGGSGAEESVVIEPVSGSEMHLDGRTWLRFEAMIGEGALGFADVSVTDGGAEDLFIAGVTVLDVSGNADRASVARHPASELQKRLSARARHDRQNDRRKVR